MRRKIVVGISLLILGISANASEAKINLDSFLKSTLEEYRRFAKEDMIAELEYKISTAESGLVIDSRYNKNKNISTNIDSGGYYSYFGDYVNYNSNNLDGETQKGEQGSIILSKTNRYGTKLMLSDEYIFSDEERTNIGYYGIIKSKKEAYKNTTTLYAEQSIFRSLLKGFLSDKISMNKLNSDKNKILESETYILNRALENYIKYNNTIKTIESLERLNGEISQYIVELETTDNKSKFKINQIRLIAREIEATIAKEKQNTNMLKYLMCKFINKSYSDNSIIFVESSKEEIIEAYSKIIDQLYSSKIKKEKLNNEWLKFVNESKKIDTMPEVTIFGAGRGIKYNGKESVKESSTQIDKYASNKEDTYKTPDYVIGLKIRMELFDGISKNKIKLQEEQIKISEENYKKMEKDYIELKKLAKLSEQTAYEIVEIKEKKIIDTKNMIDGGKIAIKELMLLNDLESRRLLNDEISDLGLYIRNLQSLYSNLNFEIEAYYKTIFSDTYKYY